MASLLNKNRSGEDSEQIRHRKRFGINLMACFRPKTKEEVEEAETLERLVKQCRDVGLEMEDEAFCQTGQKRFSGVDVSQKFKEIFTKHDPLPPKKLKYLRQLEKEERRHGRAFTDEDFIPGLEDVDFDTIFTPQRTLRKTQSAPTPPTQTVNDLTTNVLRRSVKKKKSTRGLRKMSSFTERSSDSGTIFKVKSTGAREYQDLDRRFKISDSGSTFADDWDFIEEHQGQHEDFAEILDFSTTELQMLERGL